MKIVFITLVLLSAFTKAKLLIPTTLISSTSRYDGCITLHSSQMDPAQPATRESTFLEVNSAALNSQTATTASSTRETPPARASASNARPATPTQILQRKASPDAASKMASQAASSSPDSSARPAQRATPTTSDHRTLRSLAARRPMLLLSLIVFGEAPQPPARAPVIDVRMAILWTLELLHVWPLLIEGVGTL